MDAEKITIVCMTAIALSAIWQMPAESAEKVALALGSALGGYLTKAGVDLVKNVLDKPTTPKVEL